MKLRQMAAEAWRDERKRACTFRLDQQEKDYNRIVNRLARMGISRDNNYDRWYGSERAVLVLDGVRFRLALTDGLEMFVVGWPADAKWEWVCLLDKIGAIIERGPDIPEQQEPHIPVEERIARSLSVIESVLATISRTIETGVITSTYPR